MTVRPSFQTCIIKHSTMTSFTCRRRPLTTQLTSVPVSTPPPLRMQVANLMPYAGTICVGQLQSQFRLAFPSTHTHSRGGHVVTYDPSDLIYSSYLIARSPVLLGAYHVGHPDWLVKIPLYVCVEDPFPLPSIDYSIFKCLSPCDIGTASYPIPTLGLEENNGTLL
jgi:hypothetical protein